MNALREPAVWFPTVRTGTGTEVFTERMAEELGKRGIRNEITWLPLRAEYAPWTVPVPEPPEWATVAHVNTWLHPRFLPRRLPVVATIHHSMHHADVQPYKGFVRAAYHRWWIAPNERRVLRRADRVIAVSRFVAETARQFLLDVPMDVIYNGVDTNRYWYGGRQRRLGEPFRLLYVGGWKKLKGVDLLAPIMRELGDGFELRYTGGPMAARDHARMPSTMRDLGRLQGVDSVVAAMQDADAFLFPSRSEGFPLALIEAMACGLPVIATHGSSLAEAVEEAVSGILCTQGDETAFVIACRQIANDHALHASMTTAARRRAVECFSVDRMVAAYTDLYARMAKSTGGTP